MFIVDLISTWSLPVSRSRETRLEFHGNLIPPLILLDATAVLEPGIKEASTRMRMKRTHFRRTILGKLLSRAILHSCSADNKRESIRKGSFLFKEILRSSPFEKLAKEQKLTESSEIADCPSRIVRFSLRARIKLTRCLHRRVLSLSYERSLST